MGEGTQRRLAAIVAADVVGYSRLMGADETGTLTALLAHRAELLEPAVARHGGRIVKTTGDGVLIEFASVVAAVECAIAMQEGMAARNSDVPEDHAIRFRIGVHVGDVIVEGDDLYGDGVNVAARIEGLAEPGGISLSDDAHRHVRDRVQAAWEDAGEQRVKNIARPVHVWRWAGAGVTRAADDEEIRPAIAVLPFDNMSGDPEQEYFADGMTEDLITDLSKVSGLMVVSRNSSFTFKGTPVEMREVARRLGVRYVVEGSVRKAGQRVRINVQLIDAVADRHIWAERYDGTVDNVFELQDDVGAKVVEALSVRLKGDEGARLKRVHTDNLEAYELYVRAKATPYPPVPDRIEAARAMFGRVAAMDPDFAGGHAGLAWMLAWGAIFGHAGLRASGAEALVQAERAVALDDSFAASHFSLALALLCLGRHDEARAAAETAVARQPSDSDAHSTLGMVLTFGGAPADGLGPVDEALRLNPEFVNGPYMNMRAIFRSMAGDHAGAVEAFRENVARSGPVGPPVLAWVTTSLTSLGRADEAAELKGTLNGRFPAFRVTGWNFLELVRSDADRARYREILVAAGVPE